MPFKYKHVHQEADPAWLVREPYMPRHRNTSAVRGILKSPQTSTGSKTVRFNDQDLARCIETHRPAGLPEDDPERPKQRFRQARAFLSAENLDKQSDAEDTSKAVAPRTTIVPYSGPTLADMVRFEIQDEEVAESQKTSTANREKLCREAVARGSLDLAMFVHRDCAKAMTMISQVLKCAMVNDWPVGSYTSDEKIFAVRAFQTNSIPEWLYVETIL
ncbi:hypothetical protein QQZ08_002498 [Neonectria magnoliae]|uniref:Uncharacterized protein n=1 Tax=Neonectria magnoliae TaxID=2732573 RepID=A0ABR1ID99_9HYPO